MKSQAPDRAAGPSMPVHFVVTGDHIVALRHIQHVWRCDDEADHRRNAFCPAFRILVRFVNDTGMREMQFPTREAWNAAWDAIVQGLTGGSHG